MDSNMLVAEYECSETTIRVGAHHIHIIHSCCIRTIFSLSLLPPSQKYYCTILAIEFYPEKIAQIANRSMYQLVGLVFGRFAGEI